MKCHPLLIQPPNEFECAAQKRHDRFFCAARQYVELDRRYIRRQTLDHFNDVAQRHEIAKAERAFAKVVCDVRE